MTWEIAFVLALLLTAVVLFISEKLSPDLTSFGIFVTLMLAGALAAGSTLPAPDQLLTVFSNAAPITIAAMFVISSALEKCGALEGLGGLLKRVAKLGIAPVMALMVLTVGLISAFMNNTPVVVIFVPIILGLAREMGQPASKMLIPLSYASIFGGTCTLVGTSTNILASGILQNQGMAPIGMFELAWVGLPLLIAGAAYLALIGPRLLPRRDTLTALLSDEERKEFITTAFIRPDSQLVGHTLKDSNLLRRGVRVLEIIRNEVAVSGDLREVVLKEGDRLVLAARPSGLSHTRSEGVNIGLEANLGVETIAAHEGSIVEGVIAPRSALIGQTLGEIKFRQRYRMIVLAIHRRGVNLRNEFETQPLEFGDTLLMMGTDEAREALRRDDDILLLDRPPTPSTSQRRKGPMVLAIVAAVVLSVSFNLVPIAVAALSGAALMLAIRVISPKDAYESIDWSILILIYGMLGLGQAMESTGAAAIIAEQILILDDLVGDTKLRALLVLAGIYLLSSILTEVMSNNATVVLITPIAIGIALQLGLDPRAFVIATTIAASASFATPIGYQTNTYVYGVGNYKFSDFVRIGVPMNLVYFVVSMIMIPIVWGF